MFGIKNSSTKTPTILSLPVCLPFLPGPSRQRREAAASHQSPSGLSGPLPPEAALLPGHSHWPPQCGAGEGAEGTGEDGYSIFWRWEKVAGARGPNTLSHSIHWKTGERMGESSTERPVLLLPGNTLMFNHLAISTEPPPTGPA